MKPDGDVDPIHVPTLVAMALIVYAAGIGLHELAHAIAAAGSGADPTLVSSTDMRGDMSALSRAGTAWTGAAGSLANWTLAGGGLLILAVARSASWSTFGWITAAVNGFIPSVYMVASPALGFGDWQTVIARFDGSLALRLSILAAGLALAGGWVVVATRGLVALVSATPPAGRADSALRITRTVWATGGALAICAALPSPLGLPWALSIAIGSTLGTTWPLLPVGGRVADAVARGEGTRSRRVAAPGANGPELDRLVPPSPGWLIFGVAAATGFVAAFGPGIRL